MLLLPQRVRIELHMWRWRLHFLCPLLPALFSVKLALPLIALRFVILFLSLFLMQRRGLRSLGFGAMLALRFFMYSASASAEALASASFIFLTVM